MNDPKNIEKRENGAGSPEAERKPKKKRPRVSQRKELAVVSIGMVAAITSFGGLLAGHQAQANQPASATPVAQVSSTTPGSSSSGQSSKQQAPAYSPATQSSATPAAQASHAQSHGS